MIVFFSGGTGMRGVARELARRDILSSHIITTFDSGGSSGALRQVFSMPAVGDLRNRLVAMANPACSAVAAFLDCRLSGVSATPQMAANKLAQAQIPALITRELQIDLDAFLRAVPPDFDARGASVGNLAITGAYLRFNRQLNHAVSRYARILRINGQVFPVACAQRELAATLANGHTVIGQHNFRKLPAPVAQLYLANGQGRPQACDLDHESEKAISGARLICFPMGSFYSSIMANFLPRGVGRAIARNPALKLFIPNTGYDPELFDLDIVAQARAIMSYLGSDAPDAPCGNILNAVLLDPENGRYAGGYDGAIRAGLLSLGLNVVEAPIVSAANAHNPVSVADVLENLLQ